LVLSDRRRDCCSRHTQRIDPRVPVE